MKRNNKRYSIIQLLLAIAIIIFINVIAAFVFTRFDLTSENRYSISPSSVAQLQELKDVIYFKIYLDGDLPPGFKRLKNATKEMLDEFKVYAGDNIEYEFIDPSANPDKKAKNDLYKQLSQKGLQPTNLEERSKAGTSEKIIFPGAIINYKNKEVSLLLLKSRMGSSSEEMLNSSIEGLEYELSNTLRKLTSIERPKIGFLQGHGELTTKQLTDAARALGEFYTVDTVYINGRLNTLKDYKAIIIAKPDTAFTEKDKFVIDQYIMKGGRVLWLIDAMQINIDSLAEENSNVAIGKELNLEDQLFKYGVRVNNDLVMDLQAAPIPLVTGYQGNQPIQNLFPWYFFPLLNPTSSNPIVHNLNAIKCEFASTVDTVKTDSVTKTVLLTTSKYSKNIFSPARVSVNIVKEEPDPRQYNKSFLPVAVLLEGKFNSVFTNRLPEQIATDEKIDFKSSSKGTKMIVVGDGDVISNYVTKKGAILPLGFDRYTNQVYGNKNFILNSVDYLCDENDLVALRGKEFKLRLLDKSKTENAMIPWISLLAPVVIVLIYGIIHFFIRRKKYER